MKHGSGLGEPDQTWDQIEQAANDGDHRRVALLLRRLDAMGEWRATARLGEMYELGAVGVERNLDEALAWYRKAAFESDDPIAHLGLGRILFGATSGVGSDLETATQHLLKAFDKGLPAAGIYLGIAHMFGHGRELDLSLAERYFVAAAHAGYPLAYRYLADIAAQSGHLLRALLLRLREIGLSMRLRLSDPAHPNLWKLGDS